MWFEKWCVWWKDFVSLMASWPRSTASEGNILQHLWELQGTSGSVKHWTQHMVQCLGRMKPENTPMEVRRDSNVQIDL
jgi:hypothetical protein